jgi:hypothetical protein
MDATADYHVEEIKPDSERQILHIFSDMQNGDFKK